MKKVPFLFLVLALFFASSCSSKIEPISIKKHKATMKSYTILGKRYYPVLVKKGDTMRGISSWYGPNFHTKQTSSGERYNMYASTAAHKTWPMDTIVRVSNLENKKSTIVRINDRGPFVKGRIIDCSYQAGKKIGLDKMGIAKVKIEVISLGNHAGSVKNISKHYSIDKYSTHKGHYVIQIASFSSYENAKRFEKKSLKGYRHKALTKAFLDVTGKALYRVFLVGFSSEKEAHLFKQNNGLFTALVMKG